MSWFSLSCCASSSIWQVMAFWVVVIPDIFDTDVSSLHFSFSLHLQITSSIDWPGFSSVSLQRMGRRDEGVLSLFSGVAGLLGWSEGTVHCPSAISTVTSLCTGRTALHDVCLLVACLTSQQHASVSQELICSDNFTYCHTEIEVTDQTFYLTQAQYTDNRPTSPSADPITPGAWQGSNWSANF